MADEVEGLTVAFVDCESTGIGQEDEPISIGVVVVKLDAKGYGEPIAEWYGEQAPGVRIHPAAQRVHGRTAESLKGKAFDVAGLRATLDQAMVLVAHHATFDARMIRKVLPDLLDWEWRCSRRQWVWPAMANKKLDTVCAHFGVERPGLHNALADAHVLRETLMQRTGKTERSRTYMHRLLHRGECDVRPRPPRSSRDIDWDRGYQPQGLPMKPSAELQRVSTSSGQAPKEPERPVRGHYILWAIIAVVFIALVRACGG